jgi:hypothetical protein
MYFIDERIFLHRFMVVSLIPLTLFTVGTVRLDELEGHLDLWTDGILQG